MVATCFALLARAAAGTATTRSPSRVFFALGELGYALVAHSALALSLGPSDGSIKVRAQRFFLEAMYATVLAFPLAILLVHGRAETGCATSNRSRGRLPLSISTDPGARTSSRTPSGRRLRAVLAAAFIVLAPRKLWLATPNAGAFWRRSCSRAVVAALWALYNSVVAFVSPAPRSFSAHNVFWWQITALIALPFTLFVGLDPLAARPCEHRRPRPPRSRSARRRGGIRDETRAGPPRPDAQRSSSGCRERGQYSSTSTGCPVQSSSEEEPDAGGDDARARGRAPGRGRARPDLRGRAGADRRGRRRCGSRQRGSEADAGPAQAEGESQLGLGVARRGARRRAAASSATSTTAPSSASSRSPSS